MKKLLLYWLLFASCAAAQTVPVSANLTDGSGNVVPGAYLHFALWNCGANLPVVVGTGSIVQTAFDMKQPSAGGTITGVVLANDKISCGNVVSTRWLVTPMSRLGQPITNAQRYNICSSSAVNQTCAQSGGAGATFDPSTAQPDSSAAPPPGYINIFGNPTKNQTWNQPAGTTGYFIGNFNFSNSTITGLAAAGSNTQVQFNDGGIFQGNSQFTFNKLSGQVTLPYLNATSGFQIGGTAPTGQCLIGNGTYYAPASCPSGGGGGSTPGGSSFQIQSNVGGSSFGGITNVAAGSVLASQGTGAYPVFQQKAVYDVRDSGFVGGGSTDNSAAAAALVTTINGAAAKVTGPPGTVYGIYNFVWPSNITLDFTSGWQLKPLTDSVTSPGGGAYDSTSGATGSCLSNGTSTSCNATITAPAGDTYVVLGGRGFSSGAIKVTSNVATDTILPIPGTNAGFSAVMQAWYIPNVTAGSHTFTCTTTTANIVGQCSFIPVSGLGPTPVLDGLGGICSNVSANSPYACNASFTSGSFLILAGSQNNSAETCSAATGGFTLVPGNAGCSPATGSNLGVAYQNAASGGAISATIPFSPSPAGHFWAAMSFGLRPGTATQVIQGGIDCTQNCFGNVTATSGGISLSGNTIPMRVKPEWWGGSGASGSNATTNTAAVNAAIKAALGSGDPHFNKVLDLTGGVYQINGETQWYSIQGQAGSRFEVDCAGGGLAQNTSNLRIMDSNGLAYGRFDNCLWEGNASSTAALLSIDWNTTNVPSVVNSLKPQFLDFYSNTFGGNAIVDTGVLIAPSGGSAQGSNINFWNPEFNSFTGAGLQAGGDNTGRNVGRFGATNAIQIAVYGGDFEGNPNWGVACYACQNMIIDGTTFEDGFSANLGPDNQTGFDMYSQNCIGGFPGVPSIAARSIRSESRRLVAGCLLDIRGAGTINQATFPTPGGTLPVGTIIMGSNLSDGKYYRVTVDSSAFGGAGTPSAPLHSCNAGSGTTINDTCSTTSGTLTSYPTFCTPGETMTQGSTAATAVLNSMGQSGPMITLTPTGSPDSSHTWTGGTSGCVVTPTTAPAAEANWSTNAFGNFQVSTLSGTNAGCTGIASANSATSITVGSWTSNLNGVVCGSPALYSTFIVEPNWGTQFTSGGITWVDQNEDGVQGQSGTGLSQSVLENVNVPGDRINLTGPNVILRNVSVTRDDWAHLSSGNAYQTGAIISNKLDVWNGRTSANASGAQTYQNWTLPRGGGRTYFSGSFADWLGTYTQVFSCGDPSGVHAACNDTWVGGRSDVTPGNDTFRNRLEYGGMFGVAVPIGTNQNGNPTRIGGGGSTGSGTPGNVEFWEGYTGSSGSTPNTGTKVASVDPNGFEGPIGGTTPATGIFTALTISGCAGGTFAKADGSGCGTSTGGTVTNTGGALTSDAIVLGNGTNDTKVSTGISSNGTTELDLGVSGTNGVLGFIGSTSGKATITGPSVAGTTTNPVVSSNTFQAPDFEGTIGAATPAAGSFSAVTDSALVSGNCVQATTGGQLTTTAGPCGTSSGTVTVTGSPTSNQLAKFSGGTSITNGDLTGDVTTSGGLATEVLGLVNKTLPSLTPGCLDYTGTAWTFVSCISSLASPGPIGSVTPSTGAFSALTVNGVNAALTIASGSQALHTNPISNSSGSNCDLNVISASGVLTTDVVSIGFNGDVTSVVGYIPSASGMLTIYAYPTANTINVKVCNATSLPSITPGFVTLNYRVTR